MNMRGQESNKEQSYNYNSEPQIYMDKCGQNLPKMDLSLGAFLSALNNHFMANARHRYIFIYMCLFVCVCVCG